MPVVDYLYLLAASSLYIYCSASCPNYYFFFVPFTAATFLATTPPIAITPLIAIFIL